MATRLAIAIILILACSPSLPAMDGGGQREHRRVIVVAPAAGFIRHTLPAMGPVPEQTDWGPEAGIFLGYFKESVSIIGFPYWADANGSHVYGAVGHVDLYFGTKRWWNPLFGFGMDATRIDDKDTDIMDLSVFAPWGKLGMRFILPVRGLSITPYAAYLFQLIDMSRFERTYHSVLFGLNMHYHFHRRLQIALKYYYCYTHDGRNGQRIRLRFISAFSRHVGVFLRAEYAKQVFDEYVSVFIGPSFVF
jgi:hypothetical protein